jgi:DNA invertase Pin-like site-specific DNA recombinase
VSLARAVDVRPEDLAGKSWAGYVRESTRGQADRYGPEIQRTEQARFAERHGLVAAGCEYIDLVSGKDTLRRSDFARMVLDAEAGAFEVLLVYDTSRFARNVADAWLYRERLARVGVTVVFCADGLISGNVETYEIEGMKTVADAAYIRRLSRNVGRGYEQKWRLFSDPGGHPPLGFVRAGERRLLEPAEGPDLDRVRRAFELYASGTWSDTRLADELGLTEAGLTEILTNPLYAGRVVRHKGRADEEERPARFLAPVDPALFERVQVIRSARRTAHSAGGGAFGRRAYPLVRLMRCAVCGSGYHGDAGDGRRRIRHSRRPACSSSATYRAERYESQVAAALNRITMTPEDVGQVLAVMRRASLTPAQEPPADNSEARAQLQERLASGEITLSAFSQEWRRFERPQPQPGRSGAIDELRLRQAVRQLERFGGLWANPAVSGELRQEAAHELFERIDIQGPEVIALHPQPNENAWLLGFAGARAGMLSTQQQVGMVGARGFEPPTSSSRTMRATKLRHAPTEGAHWTGLSDDSAP